MADQTDSPEERVNVRSIFGARTKAPLVGLEVAGHEILIPPAKARTVARLLLEAAEAADTDAFLYTWATTSLGADDQHAALILREYRAWRTEHYGDTLD